MVDLGGRTHGSGGNSTVFLQGKVEGTSGPAREGGGNSTVFLQGKVEGTSGPAREAASNHSVINQKRCYICNSANHLAKHCRTLRIEVQASHRGTQHSQQQNKLQPSATVQKTMRWISLICFSLMQRMT